MQKLAFFFSIFLIISTSYAANHKCNVNVSVQIYDAKTSKLKSYENISSDWFDVTKNPHEDPKTVSLVGKNGSVGEASVWTGTLLGTVEGNVIQASATVKINGVSANAALVMSIESPMAKAISQIDKETADEILMAPFDVKCLSVK